MGLKDRLKGLLRGIMVAMGGGSVIAMQDLDDTGVIIDDEGEESEPLPHQVTPPRH